MSQFDAKERILQIIKQKAVLRGKFILSSGKESDYYIDIKKVSFDGEFLELVSDIIADLIFSNFKTCDVAGVELGGVPLVSATVLKIKQKGFDSKGVIIRKNPKEYGTQKWIEGPDNISKVVLIEDVITTGATTLSAIDKLRQNGIEAEGVICVVNRGGLRNIADKNIKAMSIFELQDIIS
ncbi:MAG: orotate phosphoribosyltransferase [Candidatus Calescibacterium sp.]|nr:orotate phosphoribosyltransferase [Candidatus Calescibacterium sp.]MCX7734009.1 orotate phosphoribosyltransferase [bacterium]MDW8086392.1 orotate phosphoribosyltransferase [Candidatus Calescibacterium sp.]